MKTSVPLIYAIVNNALFHSSSHINQTLSQIVHILHFCLVDSLPVFVVNWIEVGAVRRSQIWKFTWLTMISQDFWTSGLPAVNEA